jgi:tRNA-dihydrouridine synthase
MAQAAERLCHCGFDIIDLNFACPVNKALKRRRGGYLMREPAEALAVTRAVLAAVDRPVTLKLRRRFACDDSDAAFWQIAEAAFDAGVAAICVHARSVEVKYAGPADWAFLAEVRSRFPGQTVLGSGDIFSAADALNALRQTKLDAVTVARGALGNPWFFRQVRDMAQGLEPYNPPLSEQAAVLEEHFRSACQLYGPRRGPRMMRKFGIKYARMHPTPRRVRMAFIDVRRPADWQRVLTEHYDREAPPCSV